ncbi:MAG: hypothetical protein ACOX1Q_10470 [Eubacteriales bacterium]
MEKHCLIVQLKELLQNKGITPLTDRETDIYMMCDFSIVESDDLRIHYEASVYLDDQSNIVFFWDCVLKSESGKFPHSQSRRPYKYCCVKNEKVVEGIQTTDIFHLAEIPVMIKKTIKSHGWKFKKVFNRNDSLYPTLVFSSHYTKIIKTRVFEFKHKPADLLAGVMRGRFPRTREVFRLLILFLPLLWITVVLYLKGDVTFFSWCLAAVGILTSYKLIDLDKNKNLLTTLIVWFITVLMIIIIYLYNIAHNL